jgi:hypothetical protein
MTRSTRLVVLAIGLVSLLGILSSSAGAVTWHNTGATAFTATAGPGTLTGTGAPLQCTGATTADTVPALTVGTVLTISGTATFTGCTLGTTATVSCKKKWTFFNSGPLSVGVDVSCDIYQFGTKICGVAGSVSGIYTNPTGATPGKLALNTGGSLTLSNGTSGTCPLGPGEASHLSALTFNVSSGSSPIITRTP